jgi:hypothetical protein
MNSAEIGKKFNLVLSADYIRFIDESIFKKYDGFRPKFLVKHWAEAMNYPLCFDPEEVMNVCGNASIWNAKDPAFTSMVPLAVFYNANSVDELNDMDDFIAVRGETSENSSVHLWDHEGYFTLVSKSLNDFLGSLIEPSDEEWEMEE